MSSATRVLAIRPDKRPSLLDFLQRHLCEVGRSRVQHRNVGQTYFYFVGYDNPAMNGAPGCPGTTYGFNATNSGAITWI